jgi:2'-5' RNA ligase
MPAETFLALVCPEFALADYEQIQRWRREHDAGRADLVLPHFILVDAVSGWKPGDFAAEVEARLLGQTPFEIVLSQAVSHQDDSGAVMDWLVPSTGRDALGALRTQLYSGAFASEAHAGASPHITIGRGSDAAASQARVKAINEAGLSMRGQVSGVQIVRYKGDAVKRVERVPLGRKA